jgi:hypothetical protein
MKELVDDMCIFLVSIFTYYYYYNYYYYYYCDIDVFKFLNEPTPKTKFLERPLSTMYTKYERENSSL